MKIYIYIAMCILPVSLCAADMIFPSAATGMGHALIGGSIADSNYVGPAVIALSECDCPGIIIGGSGLEDDLIIFNSGMHINSHYNPGGSSGAFDQSGTADPVITANYINVVGGIDANYDWPEDVYVHDYAYGIVPVPDPYERFTGEQPLPDHDLTAIRALPDKGTIADANEPMIYTPGYYSGGIQINLSGTSITLESGDYYLDSIGQVASLKMTSGLMTGEGVTLHIIGDANYGVEIQGNASIDISAPTAGVYEGICVYQKRNPNYNCEQSCMEPWSYTVPMSEFNGTGVVSIDGVVYMPHNRLELGGTGYIYLRRVVADRFYVYGTSEKLIDGGNYYVPGDFIRNGSVDIDDLLFFCWQWSLESPLTEMYMESNLNYDMNVDLADFAIFASHWQEVGY